MDDSLDRVLRLVADGRLTASDAEPILAALDAARGRQDAGANRDETPPREPATGGDAARALRIEVRENGRSVVNLRFPLALGRAALDRLPGLGPGNVERVREALRSGVRGPILEVDEGDGDGVRIVLD